MVSHASLFSQMLLLIDRHGFEREVRRLDAERHSKGFSESAKKSGVGVSQAEVSLRSTPSSD